MAQHTGFPFASRSSRISAILVKSSVIWRKIATRKCCLTKETTREGKHFFGPRLEAPILFKNQNATLKQTNKSTVNPTPHTPIERRSSPPPTNTAIIVNSAVIEPVFRPNPQQNRSFQTLSVTPKALTKQLWHKHSLVFHITVCVNFEPIAPFRFQRLSTSSHISRSYQDIISRISFHSMQKSN